MSSASVAEPFILEKNDCKNARKSVKDPVLRSRITRVTGTIVGGLAKVKIEFDDGTSGETQGRMHKGMVRKWDEFKHHGTAPPAAS